MIQGGKKIYLCTPDLKPLCELNGIKTETVEFNEHVKDYDTLSFEIDEYISINGKYVKSNGYDDLKVYMNLYLEDIGCFQMQHPNVNNDGFKESKTITAYSLEKEFEDKSWIGLKVNTGETDSLEQLADNNVDDLGFAKEFIKFYNPTRKDLSLIHLILTKMDGWSVVDEDIDLLLWDLKLSLTEDNINLYALFTSVIAPKAECIFLFDTINKRIKAVSKYNLDYDTNIFIGFRNLEKSVSISVEEDSVCTKFNCQGNENLTINNVNYNDSSIYNFSYFMCNPYMDEELITKLQKWIDWRESHRDEFIALAKSRADIQSKMDEIKYRVPNDGDNWKQWDDMTEELLHQNLKYYTALLTSLQVSVDDDPQYDADGNYIPWKKSDGSIDDESYLNLLYDVSNGYGGYYTYIEITKYIIPNINIAIENLGIIDDNKKDYVKDFETNWELYGTEELTGKKNSYENQLESLKSYSKAWADMTEEEKAGYPGGESEYNTLGHSKYVEISELLGSETTQGSLLFYLKKLNDELSVLQSQLDTTDEERKLLVEQADIKHSSYGLTDNELVIINTLIHTKDYQNNNILTTSIDTTITEIDREKELYDDSVSKLSEACEPQFTFTTELDNLFGIEEFKQWRGDCKLLRFIRLGIRDDYSVKLRIIGMSWNPCEIEPELTLEFSNMITSRSGRSDLTDLLSTENNRGSNNSISIGTGNSDTDKEYVTSLLQLMIKNNLFKNSVSNIANNTNGLIDESEIVRIVGNYAKFMTIDVGKITGDEASFKKFFGEYIDADYVVGNSAVFKEMDVYIANIKQAIIGTSSTETGIVFNLTSENATIDQLFVKNEIAKYISVADLQAGNIVLTDAMQILSENGKMVMNGTALQIHGTDLDGNDYIGIQLGYDISDNPSLILRNEDGALILTPSGITENAIADKMINNNMLGDKSVSKRNLDWTDISEGVDENGNPIWNIANIYMNGKQFGVEYTSFQEKVNGDVKDLNDEIDKISNSISKFQTIEIIGEQVFVENKGIITPSSITLRADTKETDITISWYIDDIENTSYVSEDKYSITIPSDVMKDKKSIIIKAQNSDGSIYDVFTVYKVVDGLDGNDGITSFIQSSNGYSFKDDTAITTTECSVVVYHGSDRVIPISYKWYELLDDGVWTEIGTTPTVTVNLNKFLVRNRIKCEFELSDDQIKSSNDNPVVFRGVLDYYSDLPVNPQHGDMYCVLNDDLEHGVHSGDYLIWNDEKDKWENTGSSNKLQEITSDEIDSLIDELL